ncbi:helix-turn-helix transcriptional regulator [Mesorhizobium sp. INR15]|uniref:ArsR/SmtB family transcription factor n=1 Tax=Mesorhizobium sp. INR15 TaxID=2654248 RepID=UPI0018964C7C|nr:metalloregulator ArsR/SmtB family transcription factor [Mesorhizobium sp. INR15]QPC91514.1 metalloregulator ArsR/SmtB family transcription factor [Mesorhizobium sp. INR15]
MNYARKRIAEIKEDRRKAISRDVSVPKCAAILTALAHPTRLLMMVYLLEGDATVADLLANVGGSRSGLSQHLKEMREIGLIDSRSEGTWRIYFCNSNEARIIVRWLEKLADQGKILQNSFIS